VSLHTSEKCSIGGERVSEAKITVVTHLASSFTSSELREEQLGARSYRPPRLPEEGCG